MHLSGEQVRAYALGELPEPQVQTAEAHLLTCAACRASVRLSREELVRLTERLAPIEPSPATWAAIRRRLRPVDWRPWLAAAAVLILVLGSWGGWQQHGNMVLREEQQLVASWLGRPDAVVRPLTDRAQHLKGRLILAADHTALFVLPPPPPGQRYHAWVSDKAGWKFGDPLRLVHTSTDGVFQVAVGTTDYLCLEREAHPLRPLPAHVVGFLFL